MESKIEAKQKSEVKDFFCAPFTLNRCQFATPVGAKRFRAQ